MVDYKEILRLSGNGYSLRQIAASVGHSHHTVKNVLEPVEKYSVSWPLDDDVTNSELEKLFYPDRKTAGKTYAEPNYEYIHKELSKKGVTLTLLWQEYRELAEYYGTAIVPARVRKPQDKGLVEKSVGFSTTWITAALRERKFFSFAEVKNAVAERLEIINIKPFQKRPGCRREAYLAEEKEFMLPLPKRAYEPSVWKQQLVYQSSNIFCHQATFLNRAISLV